MSKKPVAVTLRKPQASADSFVSGERAAAPLMAAPAQAVESGPIVQHGERAYRELTLYLPNEVARELSLYCMDRNCDLNRVVAEAVSKHVGGSESMPASAPSWRGAVEILIEQSRLKLSTVWALKRWGV
jgi:hypothetical protein